MRPREVQEEVLPQAADSEAPSGLVEFCLYFYQGEIDQMEEDTALLVRKGILRVNPSASRVERLQEFIRFACMEHVHQAVQKMMTLDMNLTETMKKALSEVKDIKAANEQKAGELAQKEAELQLQINRAEELVTKYMALLQSSGALEPGDGQDGGEGQ